MVTMKDIAREAGVSHGTVSNVLNKTGKVSVEKIKLVEEAARKLGYIQNTQAHLLRQGSSNTVALIVPSLKEETCLDLYSSLKLAMEPFEYDIIVYTTNDIPDYEKRILEKLPFSNLLAIVTITSVKLKDDNDISPYDKVPCPIIFVNRGQKLKRKNDTYIAFEPQIVSHEIANYIQDRNFQNIAFFSSPGDISYTKEIFKETSALLINENININHFSSVLTTALSKAFDILLTNQNYDLIITNNMFRADAILNAIELLNIKQPPQVITLTALTHMPNERLTIYELDFSKIGESIGKMLLDYIQNQKKLPDSTLLSPKGFPLRFPNVKKLEHDSISLLTLDAPSTNALRKLTPLFEKISGIHLKIFSMSYDDLVQQTLVLNEHHYYDLIRTDIVLLDSVGKSIYRPLYEVGFDFKSVTNKLILNLNSKSPLSKNQDYALPFDPSTQILLYRKDLFEDALISRTFYEKYRRKLDVPTTIDEYIQIAEFFTKEYNPQSPTKYGATISNGNASVTASDFSPYMLAELSSDGDNLKEKMVSAMKKYQQMACYSSPQSWWSDNIRQFATEQSATTIVYSNFIANSKHTDIQGRLGAATVPGQHPLIGGGVIGMCKYSSKLEACKQFLTWYYSNDIASLLLQLGGVSPLNEAYTNTKYFDFYPWLPTAKKNFELATRGLFKTPNCSIAQYEFNIGTAIRNMILGTMTIDEAYDYIKPYLK